MWNVAVLLQVEFESALEHPFFVFDQGWASCYPERTLQCYGLKCHQLQVGDVCISLTPRTKSNKRAENPRKRRWSAPDQFCNDDKDVLPVSMKGRKYWVFRCYLNVCSYVMYCVTVQGDDYFEVCGSPLVGQLEEPQTCRLSHCYGMTHWWVVLISGLQTLWLTDESFCSKQLQNDKLASLFVSRPTYTMEWHVVCSAPDLWVTTTHWRVAMPSINFWIDPPVGHTGLNTVFQNQHYLNNQLCITCIKKLMLLTSAIYASYTVLPYLKFLLQKLCSIKCE